HLYTPRCRDSQFVYSQLMDMNGDGLPDRVIHGGVQLNDGQAFGSQAYWGYDGYPELLDVVYGNYTTQLIDLNGDCLPDRVVSNGDGTYTVYFNTGRRFAPVGATWSNVSTTGNGTSGWSNLQSWDAYTTKTMFIDMNGDGLVDRVIRDYSG